MIEVLQAHDVFGEESAILKVPTLFGLRAAEETRVLQIPGELLRQVPSLFWKLLDHHHQRTVRSVYHGEERGGFSWRDTLSLNVAQTDRQHMRLIEIGNAVIEHLDGGVERDSLVRVLNELVAFTRYHFTSEEELMSLYQYADREAHRKMHQDLLNQLTEYADKARKGKVSDKAGCRTFFEGWILKHILEEDRKYAEYLNTRGVY